MPTPEQLRAMQQTYDALEMRARGVNRSGGDAQEIREKMEQLKIAMRPNFKLLTGKIERATLHSAAFDLYYTGPDVYVGDEPTILCTGVRTEFDPGYVAIVKEKSGLALKGLELKAGVVDADYRDEWKCIVRFPIRAEVGNQTEYIKSIVPRMDWTPFLITSGMRIAQFMLFKLPEFNYHVAEGAEIILKNDPRKGGFGSTGK